MPDKNSPLTAFVNFPSPYTQTLLVKALVSTLSSISISLIPPSDEQPPKLQWADYDLLSFDVPHSDPSYLISSYVYRKALIRKHQLHLTITEYLAKCQHRGVQSVLSTGVPKGWVLDIQFADELDELLLDDLYELGESLQQNEGRSDKQWFILKPGFADRAQGIRMFSSEEELRAIFESFEPPSDDEEQDEEEEEDETEAVGTGVMAYQLRHFVVQEYIPRPLLFNLSEGGGHKFHLRAYVLLAGDYTLYLSHTLLALFSAESYADPSAEAFEEDVELALRPHLTNTCLQTDAYGAPIREEGLVKLFWELEGQEAIGFGPITRQWLDQTFNLTGQVISETVKAGVECGSFGLQLIPNAFEIFGVDLLLSDPTPSGARVTLLEFNASPDFHQSGDRLQKDILEMFKGVVRLIIKPFFSGEFEGEDAASERWKKIGGRDSRPT